MNIDVEKKKINDKLKDATFVARLDSRYLAGAPANQPS